MWYNVKWTQHAHSRLPVVGGWQPRASTCKATNMRMFTGLTNKPWDWASKQQALDWGTHEIFFSSNDMSVYHPVIIPVGQWLHGKLSSFPVRAPQALQLIWALWALVFWSELENWSLNCYCHSMPKVNISPVEDHVKSVAKTAFQKVPSNKLVVGSRDMEKRDLQNWPGTWMKIVHL